MSPPLRILRANEQRRQSLLQAPGLENGERTTKKLLFAAGFLAIATPAWAQVYVYPSAPYGYGAGYYNYASPYAPEPHAAVPPGFYGVYGFDPTANNWEYYRSSAPGRGWDAESQR